MLFWLNYILLPPHPLQPTPSREPSSLLEWPRREGGRAKGSTNAKPRHSQSELWLCRGANRWSSERRAEGLARWPEGESQLVRAIPREEEEADRQPRMSIDRRIYPIITLMYRCAGLLCSFFFCFLIVDLLGSTFENRDITMSLSPISSRPR